MLSQRFGKPCSWLNRTKSLQALYAHVQRRCTDAARRRRTRGAACKLSVKLQLTLLRRAPAACCQNRGCVRPIAPSLVGFEDLGLLCRRTALVCLRQPPAQHQQRVLECRCRLIALPARQRSASLWIHVSGMDWRCILITIKPPKAIMPSQAHPAPTHRTLERTSRGAFLPLT